MTKKQKALAKRLASLTKQARDFHTARKRLAPSFMRAFEKALANGQTLLVFLRELDPTIPMDRKGWSNHPTVRTADLVRRLYDIERGRR